MANSLKIDALLLRDDGIDEVCGGMYMVSKEICEQIALLFDGSDLKLFEGTVCDSFSSDKDSAKIQGIIANYGDKVLIMLLLSKMGGRNLKLLVAENTEFLGNYSGKVSELGDSFVGKDIQEIILAMHDLYTQNFSCVSQNNAIITLK